MTAIALIFIPLAAALLFLIVRSVIAARITALALLVELAVAVAGPVTTVDALGVTFAVTPIERFCTAIATLVAIVVLVASAEPGLTPTVIPAGLVALACINVAIGASGSTILDGLAITSGLVLLAPVLVRQLGDSASPETGRIYLTWIVVGGATLLTGRALGRLYAAQPGPGILGPAMVFFIVGVGILLAAFPFAFWLPSLSDESPLGTALVVGFLQTALTSVVAQASAGGAWLVTTYAARLVCTRGGSIAAMIAAFLALGEKRSGRAMALLVGANADLALAALVAHPAEARVGVVWLLGTQALAAAITLAGIDLIHGKLDGLAWRRPLLAASLAVAALSLVGLPLTAGFVGRWVILRAVESSGYALLLGTAVSGILGGLALATPGIALFQRTDAPRLPISTVDVLFFAMAVLLVIGGLDPNPVLHQLAAAANG